MARLLFQDTLKRAAFAGGCCVGARHNAGDSSTLNPIPALISGGSLMSVSLVAKSQGGRLSTVGVVCSVIVVLETSSFGGVITVGRRSR